VKTISQTYAQKGAGSSGLGPLALPPGLQKVVENNYWFFLGRVDSAALQQNDSSRDLDLSQPEEEDESLDRDILPTSLLYPTGSAVSGSLVSKRRAASTSALSDKSRKPPMRVHSYKEISSSEEEEEGHFCRDPKKRSRSRRSGRGEEGSGTGSRACTSQDVHYACRPARPAVTPSPLSQEGVTVSSPLDIAAGATPAELVPLGSKKRFMLGRSKRK